MTIDPENWLQAKAAAADKQLRDRSFVSKIKFSDGVMASVGQIAPIVVSDNAPWIAAGLASLATACSAFFLLPSSLGLTDPWMSFWLF